MTLQPRARFKADCIYGATGSGKTHQVAIAAKRTWERFKERTRLIAADTGGFDTLGTLVDDGIVIPCIMVGREHPIEALAQLCQGWWLKDDEDPTSELVKGSMPSDVGMYAIEGLTSLGDLQMDYLSSHKVRLSQDPAYTYVDGKTEFSGTNMSYFGEVQKQLHARVRDSSLLPVRRVNWTALEGRGEEEGTKSPLYGPSIIGKKATGKAGQWFGNLLHLEILVTETVDSATKQVNLNQRRVMYLMPHADPVTKIPFPAKVRAPFDAPAGSIKQYMDPPDIGKLYDLLESLKVQSVAR